MNSVKNKILIIIPFFVYIIIIPLYIHTYKIWSNTFWIIFFIERIFSFLYEDILSDFLEELEENKVDNIELHMLIGMILFAILGILTLIYISVCYFRLFAILMIGEVLDKVFDKIRNCIKK